MRKGELENVERNRDKSLGVTVYLGHRRGNASTSDFSEAAIERTVQAAYDIARFTAEDPVAGLPDMQDIAKTQPDLDLFHPWLITSEQAAQIGHHTAQRVRQRETALLRQPLQPWTALRQQRYHCQPAATLNCSV